MTRDEIISIAIDAGLDPRERVINFARLVAIKERSELLQRLELMTKERNDLQNRLDELDFQRTKLPKNG